MEKISFESSEPLLQDSNMPLRPINVKKKKELLVWLKRESTSLLILGIAIYIAIVVSLNSFSQKMPELDRPWTPGNVAIEYKKQKFWDPTPNPFTKNPSEEADAAWYELLSTGKNVRISGEEMEKLGENMTNAVQLTDGDYLGVLGVYHQLHCLNSIRQGLYPDYYKPRLTEREKRVDYNPAHWNHCMERIRRSIMCHADMAVQSVEWIAGSDADFNKDLRSNAEVQCVNWNAIESWASKRALKLKQFKLRAGPFEKKRPGKHS